MKMAELLRTECIDVAVDLPDKESALRHLADVAGRAPALRALGRDALIDAFTERESVGSTGIGGGIAIPHCRLESVSQFVLGLVTVPDGLPFDAPDNAPVRILAFIIAPAGQTNEHVRVLSAVSQTLSVPSVAEEILQASTPDDVRRIFLRQVPPETAPPRDVELNMFHVFVLNEDLFHSVLQVFAAFESTSVAVIETRNTKEFLSKVPLFASFWNDHPPVPGRLIVAFVRKQLTNETIRRIEHLAGKLDDRRDILVAVQPTSYCAGALQI